VGALDGFALARGSNVMGENMSADNRNYVLDISIDLFRLTTESLRLHSNETRQYQTLANLVNCRAETKNCGEEHRPDTLRKHFHAIPTDGDIHISLDILKTSAESLDQTREHLCRKLGSDMTVGDALSVLLFDYVAERKAAEVLDRMGLGEFNQNGDDKHSGQSREGNVLPFK
jgi:hypothetical protein